MKEMLSGKVIELLMEQMLAWMWHDDFSSRWYGLYPYISKKGHFWKEIIINFQSLPLFGSCFMCYI